MTGIAKKTPTKKGFKHRVEPFLLYYPKYICTRKDRHHGSTLKKFGDTDNYNHHIARTTSHRVQQTAGTRSSLSRSHHGYGTSSQVLTSAARRARMASRTPLPHWMLALKQGLKETQDLYKMPHLWKLPTEVRAMIYNHYLILSKTLPYPAIEYPSTVDFRAPILIISMMSLVERFRITSCVSPWRMVSCQGQEDPRTFMISEIVDELRGRHRAANDMSAMIRVVNEDYHRLSNHISLLAAMQA